MFQKSEAMAKPSSFGLWLTISLVGILLCFVFIGFQWFRKSRQGSGHQQNTQGKRQDKKQDKKENKQVVARSRSHRKKPDYLPHQISLRSKKQNTQNTLPPASAPAEEDEEDGWASAVGGMFSSLVSSLPTRLEELSVASSNPDVSQSPLSLFSCSDIQMSPAATPPRSKDYKKSNQGDKGRVKEHRHRDRRTDDSREEFAARPPRQPKVTPHDKYDVDDSKRSRRRDDRKSKSEQQQSRSHKDKGSSSKKNAPPKPKGPDAAQLVQQRTKELDDAVTEAISGLSLFGHQKKEIVENTSKKVGDSASNTADAIGEKSAGPSGRLDNRVAQVNGPTFVHNNNPNHPGYSSSKYDVPPPPQPNRSGSGYSFNNYGVPPPQLPHQGGPGQGHSFGNYGVPPLQQPPLQQPHQSCPPVSHTPVPQQGVRKDAAVSVNQKSLNQTPPSNKDVEELKRREGEERDGIVTGKDGNDSKSELQRDSKRNDDGLDKFGMSGQNRSDRKHSRPDGRHADDKKRKGGRSAVHKFLHDDDSSSNSLLSSTNSEKAGTAQTGNWGFGWLSNSYPQGGTGAIIAESASTESGGSSTTSGASSGDDSASASLDPQDESVSSDSSASTSSDEESTLFSESDVE